MKSLILLIFLTGCASKFNKMQPKWVVKSNSLAKEYSYDLSHIYPEQGSQLGYTEFDAKGSIVNEGTQEKEYQLYNKWKVKLTHLIKNETNKNLKVDYLILKDVIDLEILYIEHQKELKVVPFIAGARLIYSSLAKLINDQSPDSRKKAALKRLSDYVNPAGEKPLLLAYINLMKKKINKHKKPFYPFHGEVEKYLKESNSYIKGIKELLASTKSKTWEKDFALLEQQTKTFNSYVKNKILPYTRKKPNLPRKLYVNSLKHFGIYDSPENLIKIGKSDFKTVYKKFEKLAQKIAKKSNLKSSHPAHVIKYLKRDIVAKPDDVKALYERANQKLDQIIIDNQIVTLPDHPLTIRLAGDAESKAQPIPNVTIPPLVNNKGEKPEFVVPTASSGKLAFNDFSYKAAATTLTAHEGRPGHELQFGVMLNHPISIIRGRYAFNSVNVEGWALYAEDLVFPYISDEEKLATYQLRLWRIARHYLDPQVQLGIINEKKVTEVFDKQLGVSKVMAGLEYQRYSYRMPGQAPSYYNGLLKIKNLKEDLEKSYGKLNLKCFNDTFLSFGLMPHKYIKMFKEKFKKCKL